LKPPNDAGQAALTEEARRERVGRANALLKGELYAEAENMFLALAAERPDDPDVLQGLGVVAWQSGRLEQATDYLRRAAILAINPAVYLSTLGELERLRGDLGAAASCLSEALRLEPKLAAAHNNLGTLHLTQGKYVQAVTAFLNAIRLQPDMRLAHFNLGLAFKEMNRLEEAIESYRTAIALKPDFVEAHVNLAIALLLDGQMEAGFEEYEWRLQTSLGAPRLDPQKEWKGEPIPDGDLLLYAEQGMGDAIQLARYIPFIAQQGVGVIVQCSPQLAPLLRAVNGVSATCGFDQPLPAHAAHLSFGSLPRLFATRTDTVPANIPYLNPGDDQLQRWRRALAGAGDALKVGLRWRGNPANTDDLRRSVDLSAFAGLADIDGLCLISLQNEAPGGPDLGFAQALRLVDYSAELKDFTDTAALVANLDLVISVDTAVLHLAGALGVRSWGLLRFSPHWIWLLGGEDSPWYPGMRLFRQERPGEWNSVVDAVIARLRQERFPHAARPLTGAQRLPRVLAHPADETGSGQYRIIAPLRALAEAGKVEGWLEFSSVEPAQAQRLGIDALVFQRQLTDAQIEAVSRHQSQGKAFRVFELDDLLIDLPARSVHRKTMPPDIAARLQRVLPMCDRLVVSTEPLAAAYRNWSAEVVVVPNFIEGGRWKGLAPQRRLGGKPRVGWVGGNSHGGDLEMLAGVVRELAAEVDWILMGMCPQSWRPHVAEFHYGVPFERYPQTMAALNLDLAIAPLELNAFNEAKSNLRLLEYGVLGIPVVCSDIHPYRQDLPVTRVANKHRAWLAAIREHVADLDQCARLGEALRQRVLAHWLLEDHLDLWLRAWLP